MRISDWSSDVCSSDLNDGGGHALSKAAPGYAGIVDLAERAGAEVELRRRVETTRYGEYEPLLVLTPTHRTRAPEIAELIDAQLSESGRASCRERVCQDV